jgi:dTDP-4-dehydrorhamnose reductase
MAGKSPARPRRVVLLTGATGFLGAHLLAAAPEHWALVAGLRDWEKAAEWGGLEMDLADPLSWRRRLHELAPDAILHAAAVADAGACEKDPERSYQINVRATGELARHAGARGIPFLFCSTDLVFDGGSAPYAPGDEPRPLMAYGRQKAEAEALVRAQHPGAIVARLPLLYGASADPRRGQLTALREGLMAGRPLRLFHDEYRSAAHAARVAEGLWAWLLAAAAGEDRSGTWHFGGPHRLSRYALALEVARAWGLDAGGITPVAQASVATGAPRPADVSLDSAATYARGWRHGTLAEELDALAGERGGAAGRV